MFSLRRSALRILSASPSSFAAPSRSLSSFSSQALARSRPAAISLSYQRRWASNEAEGEAPISKLQPTPQEEVENAVVEDKANATAANSSAHSPVDPTPVSPGAEGQGELRMNAQYSPKRTVYIGNLFFDITEEDLTKELSRFGRISSVRLLRDNRGLSKGFGYVDFEDVSSATDAIEALHQQLFEGRRLVVQYAAYTTNEIRDRRASERPGRDANSGLGYQQKNPPSKTLFIGNMSFEMTDRDLNNLFRGIRNVVDVRVAIDRRTGQPRGFAHADFIDIKSAQEAAEILKTKETYGRQLRIDFSFGNSMAPRNQAPPPTQGN